MTWLFASGHAVDVVLAVMMIEALVLILQRQPITTIALTFLPGMLILLALRAALTDAGWLLIAGPLAASFPVHLADLWSRGLIGTGNRGRANAAPASTTMSGSSSNKR